MHMYTTLLSSVWLFIWLHLVSSWRNVLSSWQNILNSVDFYSFISLLLDISNFAQIHQQSKESRKQFWMALHSTQIHTLVNRWIKEEMSKYKRHRQLLHIQSMYFSNPQQYPENSEEGWILTVNNFIFQHCNISR